MKSFPLAQQVRHSSPHFELDSPPPPTLPLVDCVTEPVDTTVLSTHTH